MYNKSESELTKKNKLMSLDFFLNVLELDEFTLKV